MIGRPTWRFRQVTSTQDIAFTLASLGAPDGTVVRADHQLAGRGRQGRTWESPHGTALMFSVILRPGYPLHELGSLSIMVADALANVFTSLTTQPVQIKWPNDVMIADRKVSGVLLQSRSSSTPVVVLGIGINVSVPTSDLPVNATSLAGVTGQPISVDLIYNLVIDELAALFDTWQPDLTSTQIASLETRLWQRGSQVSLLDGDREIRGDLVGISNRGGLLLRERGQQREIIAGEITRGPRTIPSDNKA